jgi:hypothetical protein
MGKLIMTSESSIPTLQKFIAILWPSFLVAGVVTVLFFLVFDPEILLEAGDFDDISLLGVYSITFFCSWSSMMACCLLTAYFARPCEKICREKKKEKD